MIVSAGFKIERTDTEAKFIGWGSKQRNDFFRQVISEAKGGKVYQLKAIEVNAAGVHRNYMFMCLGMAAKEFGYSQQELKATLEDLLFKCALDDQNDSYELDTWTIPIRDIDTQKITGYKLKSVYDWRVSMMNEFIEIIQYKTQESYPKFIFPDSKNYKGEIMGDKHNIAEDYMTIKL